MIKPQTNPYEFFCRKCKTGIFLPRTVKFELPEGNHKCVITESAGNLVCPNCGALYKLKKIWNYGEVKIEVYKDGSRTPSYTKYYKRAKVK